MRDTSHTFPTYWSTNDETVSLVTSYVVFIYYYLTQDIIPPIDALNGPVCTLPSSPSLSTAGLVYFPVSIFSIEIFLPVLVDI